MIWKLVQDKIAFSLGAFSQFVDYVINNTRDGAPSSRRPYFITELARLTLNLSAHAWLEQR